MRILFLGNNRLASTVARWLAGRDEEIVGAVVHPPERASHRDEILEACGLAGDAVIDASRLEDPRTLGLIQDLRPEVGVSILFGYILRKPMLDLLSAGCINLHPSFLPYNRGAHPNVWSIIDGTPAGASLHHIDESVDTGDIVAQTPVEVEPVDTGKTLHHKCEVAAFELFQRTWPQIVDGTAPRRPQDPTQGTAHRVRDMAAVERIDLDWSYTGRELIDRLRALTFSSFDNAYFEHQGRRVYLRLELYYGDDEPSGDSPQER